MAHIIEAASSGRSKCRGCGQPIAKGVLRFGERLPNPFGDGEMTLWFHLLCAAYKRPESFGELAEQTASMPEAAQLADAVSFGVKHRRVPRIHGAQRAPSGRARCRSCRELIEKDSWRIPLVFFEEGMFNASGYVHAGCASDYFETTSIIDRLQHFAGLDDADAQALQAELA